MFERIFSALIGFVLKNPQTLRPFLDALVTAFTKWFEGLDADVRDQAVEHIREELRK